MKKVAIFDIDGTIFRSSLLIELTEALIQAGLMPKNTGRLYAQARERWLDREGSCQDYIDAVVKAFGWHLKGVSSQAYRRVADQVVARLSKRVYRIPFLKLVAKPICFNPNSKLFAYAKRQGWRVMVERKDVIYVV